MRKIIVFISVSMIIFGCSQNKTDQSNSLDSTNMVKPDNNLVTIDTISTAISDEEIIETARFFYTQLQAGNYDTIFSFVPNNKGILFTPYAYIDTVINKRFTQQRFMAAVKSGEKINWGVQEGSGDPILLDVKGYMKKYVTDFELTQRITVQLDKFHNSGSMTDNAKTIFPGKRIVEFYKKGSAKYSGMDWRSLKIILEMSNGIIYPVAFVHNEWTP